MAIIWFIFIIFPCHCAVYMYKIMILQKPDLANFHQISHWSFCWNVIDSLFKWSCSIDCQAHIFFFKTKNCSNDDFISCDDRIMWANRGQWASCFFFYIECWYKEGWLYLNKTEVFLNLAVAVYVNCLDRIVWAVRAQLFKALLALQAC